jgi:hypothetical protein
MIGSLTRLDPLPTTFDHPARILRSIILAVNNKIGENLKFLRVLSRRGKVTVRLLSAPSDPFFTESRGDLIAAGHGLMYIGALVLGDKH